MDLREYLNYYIYDNIQDESTIEEGINLVDELENHYLIQLKNQNKIFKIKIDDLHLFFEKKIKNISDDLNKKIKFNKNIIKHGKNRNENETDEINKINDLNDFFLNKLKNVMNELDMKIKIYEKNEKDIKKLNKSFKTLFTLGKIFNIIFFYYWNINKKNLIHIDFISLADNTILLEKKDKIIDSCGLKFALVVLHDIYEGIDKEICEIYLKLNDFHNPKIIENLSFSKKNIYLITFLDSIDKLLCDVHFIRNNIDTLDYIQNMGINNDFCYHLNIDYELDAFEYLQKIGLTKKICTQLEHILKNIYECNI